ncbi:hypothetical protein ACTMS0_17820 [Micromonospora sp. H33]|uniref:hypothetical protein n=1 Tax=Micromonospora sp. H33 TaxID=3452215 RepID=UPI003F889A74
MEQVFRMLLVRNAEAADPETDAVSVPDTPLQQELGSVTGDVPRGEVMERARAFVDSDRFVGDAEGMTGGPRLRKLRTRLKELRDPTEEQVEQTVRDVLGDDYAEQVGGTSWRERKERLADSALALKLLSTSDPGSMAELVGLLRTVRFVEAWVEDRDGADRAAATLSILDMPLVLPVLSRLRLAPQRPDTTAPPTRTVPPLADLQQVGRQVQAIDNVVRELTTIAPRFFRTVNGKPHKPGGARLDDGPPGPKAAAKAAGISIAGTQDGARLVLSDAGVEVISEASHRYLGQLGLDLSRDSVSQVVARLDAEKAGSVRDLRPAAGSTVLALADMFRAGTYGLGGAYLWRFPGGGRQPLPTTHGTVRPVGEGELLVVRQQLTGYELGEVAHIENVLRGENKQRTHRRREVTEEIFVTEREIEREEERDLETSERFELSHEASEVLKEEAEVEGGLRIRAQVSPAVVIEANARAAYTNARESARKKASEYAREVVDKSVSRLAERIRTQETRRVTREVEEINDHSVDNIDGDGHVVGVYQWVDKRYEAQVFRYGGRTIYDFVIPEPAMFLSGALEEDATREVGRPRPEPFELDAGQLTEADYLYWANKYHATGIQPPPRFEETRSVTFSSGGGGEAGDMSQRQDLTIPEGYTAVQAHVTAGFAGSQMYISVGRRVFLYESHSGLQSANLDLEEGTIPITMVANDTPLFAVSIEVVCRRTERAMLDWQIRTHAEIKQAYLEQQARFDEATARAAANQGVVIDGRNPGVNRALELTELKKACISVLTHQHFDAFDAVETGALGVPQVDVAVVEEQGNYIRFFEHAFEWQLMSFVFYPYFWGRKSTWLDRVRYDNSDPEFAEFVRSGAARVLLPVREGFETAVEHFMRTGQVWQGGPPPEITDPEYLPIVREIQERTGAPGDEVPEGAPWPVRVPTRLVRLRPDSELPSWVKQDDGTWRPVGSDDR